MSVACECSVWVLCVRVMCEWSALVLRVDYVRVLCVSGMCECCV